MPTIAELQINLDSRPIERGTQALNDFATAADKASRAGKAKQQVNDQSSSSADRAAKSEGDLSAMIDSQTRKLEQLGAQRRKLESSGMKSTMPAEYERLNRIIDANIALVNRQGNAVEALQQKQDRDVSKREESAARELRMQERIARATETRENVISRAAAREQRQIEQTINGLDRQVKAQNEYNRTLETLNKARATSGMDGGNTTMSAGEYETWVKLAKARRDAALATEDNSRAVLQAQNKLDTYTATLGRVERAEVEYARAVGVLNQAQKLGLLTADQYDQKLNSFANKRDIAVKAANDNTAAEQRFARELQSVMSAYDPVLRAQDQYNNSVRILSMGLQNGSVSVDQFNKALTQQRQALDGVKQSQSGIGNMSTEYDSALNSLVPYRAELRNLEQQEKVLRAQKESGKLVTEQQIAEYNKATSALERNRREIQKRADAGNLAAMSYKQEQAALRGMPAQITDIVVSLQGGQAPLTVLLQQGGQIKDMFGGIGPAIRGLGTALAAMLSPTVIAGSALVALGAAAYSGSQEVTEFNRAMIQTGGVSGVTAGQFSLFREQLDQSVTTAGKAATALTAIESSGRIAGDQFLAVAEAAIKMEKATGTAIGETVADFAALGKEPVDAAVRLDEKYRFLTASVLAQADALVKQGKETEAVKLLQGELSEAATATADRMIEEAGYIERAWYGIKSIVGETWDLMKSVGRGETSGDRLIKLQAELQQAEKAQGSGQSQRLAALGIDASKGRVDALKEEIKQLQQRMQVEEYGAEQTATTERKRREAVAAQSSAQKRYESSLKGVEKAENELKKVRLENDRIRAGGNVSSQQNEIMMKNEANAVKELADAREKANKPKRAGAIDNTSVQEFKNNLAMITAEYEGYYKRVTAIGDAGIVSQEATFNSQKSILEAQRKAVEGSYDQQISSIKKLQEGKGHSAAQTISLNNQLNKAESDRVIALEKIDAKMDALNSKENGRIQERTRNIAAYKAALDAQLENLQLEGARNADGVGRGSRNAGVSRQLGENDRSFEKQQRELAKSLGEGMDVDEYTSKLKDLKDAHTEMTKQIIQNDKDIQSANYDWTNGFTAAIENAHDVGMNFASSVERGLTSAFDSAGDALAEFVTTGKLDFRSFTASILADMAKIAAQQAASGALSGILGIAATAASAYFGGGANGLAAGSAGAASSSMGASQAGYSNLYFQAKGGAWSGGTQMFANGGMFTNSVVSNPTPFAMSNGAMGVMGEAGDEAIVPLARTRNGDLGIRAMGGGNGANTIVNVNVAVSSGGTTSNSDGGAGWNQFGNELGTFVEQKVYTIINKESRPGGSIAGAAR